MGFQLSSVCLFYFLNFFNDFFTILHFFTFHYFNKINLFLVLSLGNFYLIWRFVLRKATPNSTIPIIGGQVDIAGGLFIGIAVVICLIFSAIAGSTAATNWEPYLRYVNSSQLSFSQIDPANYKDPIFHKDIAYYVFKMPFLRFIRGWFFMTFLFLTFVTGAVYSFLGGFAPGRTKARLPMPLRVHLFLMSSITMFLLAWGRLFSMYELLATETVAQHGWVYGVGFADHAARIPVQKILMIIAIITGIMFLISIFLRWATWISVAGIGLFIVVAIFGGLFAPWVVQRFQVDPQEFNKEKKYIQYNIDFTRRAYNLHKIAEKPYKGTGKLTLKDITENRAVMDNVRLWDWRPLRDTYKQREARRPQYDFVDVDIDRYKLDGRVQEVMLSARELIFSKVENRLEKLQRSNAGRSIYRRIT